MTDTLHMQQQKKVNMSLCMVMGTIPTLMKVRLLSLLDTSPIMILQVMQRPTPHTPLATLMGMDIRLIHTTPAILLSLIMDITMVIPLILTMVTPPSLTMAITLNLTMVIPQNRTITQSIVVIRLTLKERTLMEILLLT